MSKEYPARAASPPGRPILPPEAENEILDTLFTNCHGNIFYIFSACL
ncbi:hypothetical protein [Oscillibacter sp. CU971]|nr:hypothetical protein [Oscillibacter sp. CU971]